MNRPISVISGTFGEAWLHLLGEILKEGKNASPRGMATKELLAVQLFVEDMTENILVHPDRNLNYRFMVAEWLWIMAGRNDVEFLARYNSNMRNFSDDGKLLAGAYGPRIHDQLNYFLERLQNPDSRQAVIKIWDSNPAPSKDIPCTLILQGLVRNRTLEGIVTMRSSDIWLGLPYDFFTFSMFFNAIAAVLELVPGSLVMNLASSHLYEANYPQALEVVANPQKLETVKSPWLKYWPNLKLMIQVANDSAANQHYAATISTLNPHDFTYTEALLRNSSIALEVLRHATHT